MTRWESASIENVYKGYGLGNYANEVKCGIMEWVKNTLRWFGLTEWLNSEEFVKCVREINGQGRRGRPLERWEDEDYMSEWGAN